MWEADLLAAARDVDTKVRPKNHEYMTASLISAVTFPVSDMAKAVDFYESLGFSMVFGARDSEFATLRAGEAYVNLALRPGHFGEKWEGRTIFRVDSADAQYAIAKAAGLEPDMPLDAPWGERYFHVCDPDGHELSFAELLPGQT
jgi:catechol 2,3-dioxygenase-like lactoylglutathione lyase family enzyme